MTAPLWDPALPVVVAVEGGLLLADPVAEAELARIIRSMPTPPADLPLNTVLLRWLQDQAAAGRSLALLDRRGDGLAEALAARVGPWLHVVQEKPPGNFLWIGPAPAQTPEPGGTAVEVRSAFPLPARPLEALWRGMRPHHWVKNLLVFLPLIAAHRWHDPAAWGLALLALAVFCLATSAVYLANDLFDLADDRAHPQKRLRPVAAGHLGVAATAGAAAALVLLALGLAGLAGAGLPIVVAGYATAAMAYSLRLKRLAYADVIWLAGLYVVRVLAGAAATGIAPSGWLIAFCGLLMGALAAAKRCAELHATPERAARRGYAPGHLRGLVALGLAASGAAVAVLLLYAVQAEAAALYPRPWMLRPLAVVLALWLARIWAMVARDRLGADPILFALRDRISWLALALVAGLFAAAAV